MYSNQVNLIKSIFFKFPNENILDKEWNYEQDIARPKANLPDMIFNLYNQSVQQNVQALRHRQNIRILFNTKSKQKHILQFNLNSLRNDIGNISAAKLHFYYESKPFLLHKYPTQEVLKIYQLISDIDTCKNISRLIKTVDVHRLLNVIYVTKSGWQVRNTDFIIATCIKT